ncbi:hypothetical protein V6N13_024811 [Hibiscus sabdariffa]
MHQSRDTSEMVAPLIAGMAWRRLLMRGGIAFGHGRCSRQDRRRPGFEDFMKCSLNMFTLVPLWYCNLSCKGFHLHRVLCILCSNRESTPSEKIKEAHRRVMVANHPDAGGSHYLASKINEAKDMMLRKNKGGSGSAF